ncbi:MAG: NAD(+) diphosphatase [Candidatus Accumulibacter sp.]|jgi:NAD+ diphosphatase|nr:NAD(+) diphosphatase [Accumulibacter sp.]
MEEPSYWLLRRENRFFVVDGDSSAKTFPLGLAADFGHPPAALRIGDWRGRPCFAAEIADLPARVPGEFFPLRPLYGLAGAEAFALAGRASELLDWQKNHRFCGHCGAPTAKKPGEFAMTCPACGLLAYPRISPAVMVLVERGDELLLARSPHFKPGVFSALAGFVEAGESVEQCAVREVREEVRVEIANLRYFQTQPWPFPNSLMIAFFADYAGGDITPDPVEIEAAAWFPRHALPPLPDQASIARRLIDAARRKSG